MTSPELNDLRVVNAIPAHIWRSAPDGAVQFVNQQWMDYTGLSQENSQGWGWVWVIHHDDRPELLDTWRRVLDAGQPKEAEARFRRFDGEYRWYLIRMVPIRDESGALLGWYGTNLDIDDLKQAQMKLRQDEKELRQMTDATQLPIIVFSAEGRLLYANRFSLTYGGLSLEDFQRDGWRERLYHPDDIEAFADARREGLARGAPFESEVRIRRAADGTYRWFLIRYNPLLDDDGNVTRWYATGSDIDDLKRAKEQAKSENAALRDDVSSASMFEEIVLAQCVRDIDAPADAFAAFERARRRRVEAIVKQSRRTGNAKAVSGPIGEWIRDRVLPLFLRLGTKAQERHYAFRLNWEQRYG